MVCIPGCKEEDSVAKAKLAFIGSGGIVRSHLAQGLQDFGDVEFAGWRDLNKETAAARREQVGGSGEI